MNHAGIANVSCRHGQIGFIAGSGLQGRVLSANIMLLEQAAASCSTAGLVRCMSVVGVACCVC